jgi:hypothetical protein
MDGAHLYATVTAIAGVILLLGWLYVTTDNPRSTAMLAKSVLLFVLPGAIVVALPEQLFQFPLSMWVLVLFEETLKAIAATTEETRADRFWLVALFGAWELTVFKPLWGLSHVATLESWSNLQLTGLTVAGLITVVMHGVTAEIYAFRFEARLPLALFVCWAIHVAFNESVGLLGLSVLSCSVLLLAVLLLFAALWPKGILSSTRANDERADRA